MVSGDIAQGNLGTVGKYDVAFKDGQLVAEVDASLGASSAGVVVKIDGRQVVDAVIAKLPDALKGLAKAIEEALLAP